MFGVLDNEVVQRKIKPQDSNVSQRLSGVVGTSDTAV